MKKIRSNLFLSTSAAIYAVLSLPCAVFAAAKKSGSRGGLSKGIIAVIAIMAILDFTHDARVRSKKAQEIKEEKEKRDSEKSQKEKPKKNPAKEPPNRKKKETKAADIKKLN